jgi:hypothetical protein
MSKLAPKTLRAFTWVSAAISIAASIVWLGFALNRDGWGHFWFMFLLAPIALVVCSLIALVPNLEEFAKNKAPQVRLQVIVSWVSCGLILVEAILSFILPKFGC